MISNCRRIIIGGGSRSTRIGFGLVGPRRQSTQLRHGSRFLFSHSSPNTTATAVASSSVLKDDPSQQSYLLPLSAAILLATSTAALVSSSDNTSKNNGLLWSSLTRCEEQEGPNQSHKPKKSKKKKSKNDKVTTRKPSLTPSKVAHEDFAQVQSSHNVDDMPIYTMEQVHVNNGDDGTPIWMTYGGYVYDVTDFIPNHPGGSEKIKLASGTAIEPFWHLYRQHYATDLPMRLMEHMVIGKLAEQDQDDIDQTMAQLEEADDPYAKEPLRHHALVVHSDTPMNAEVPTHLLTKSYLTPSSLFYIRHHHPVPFLTEEQKLAYQLELDLSELTSTKEPNSWIRKLSLEELQQLPSTTVTVTLQCSGNRRSGFNEYERTSGTPWGQGAISTAQFTGVKLSELLQHVGVPDPLQLPHQGIQHVVSTSLDGMLASIGIEKAVNPFGDVIVCYAMNGEPLSREHGSPLRLIVPGYAAVRNVKWLQRIQLSPEEAEGPWQRGLNYKTLPPSVTNAATIDIAKMPSMTEVSVFSGITHIEKLDSSSSLRPGDTIPVKASGWAWAGGGRNIVRVDVTPDNGETWYTAEFKEGKDQPFGRAWAWVFWECDIPKAKVNDNGTVQLASKAVDLAFNVQPESAKPVWNVRGLGNNSWYRAEMKVVDE